MKRNSKQLILGLLSGMTLEAVKPFFLSLEKSGYRGDVGMFVSGLDAATRDFLRARRVEMVPYKGAHFKPGRAWLAHLARPFVSARRFRRWEEKLGKGRLHPHCARYIYYRAYLAKHGAGYDTVMLADVRDIVFQNDPFAFEIPDGLSVFMEDAGKTIGTCPVNSTWIRDGFGADMVQKLHRERIFCSGTIFGPPADICDYSTRALQIFYARRLPNSIDQATFNYLLHTAPPANVHRFDNDAGPVLTMANMNPASLQVNAAGRLVTPAGRVYNTIHQYDRHPAWAKQLVQRLT